MRKRLTIIAMLLATALAAAVPAFAQQPARQPARPNRNLFGGGLGATSQLLALNLGLGSAFDQDLTVPGQPVRRDATASGNLNYSLSQQFGKLDLGVAAGSSATYYPLLTDEVISSHRANVSANFAFSAKSTLSANEWFSYAPYSVRVFYPQGLTVEPAQAGQPGLPPAFNPASGLNNDLYLNSGTSVSFRQQVTRRGSLDFSYRRNGAALSAGGGRQASQSLRGGFSYALAKGLALRAGYSADLRRSPGTGQGNWRGRTIDAGLDFYRALSISRGTTVTFGSGATGLDDGVRQRYFVTGNARLNHEIGRSWTATASYYRDVQFVDTFDDPLIGSSVTFGVSGVLGRRVQVQSSAGARMGQFGIATGAPDFRSVYVDAGVTYGITRYLALRSSYTYFNYRTGVGAVLPVGIRSRQERHSLRLTLNLWAPLFSRTRRP